MTGSVFLTALVFLIGIVAIAALGAALVWVLPLIVIVLVVAFSLPLLAKLRDTRMGTEEPAGMPTTRGASWNPQDQDPTSRY